MEHCSQMLFINIYHILLVMTVNDSTAQYHYFYIVCILLWFLGRINISCLFPVFLVKIKQTKEKALVCFFFFIYLRLLITPTYSHLNLYHTETG